MIHKVANNKYNTEKLNLNSHQEVKEKLDYFRTLFNKTHDLAAEELESLTQNVKTFFNLKSVSFTDSPPIRLVRITVNNRILARQDKQLSYLTDIAELLAPPINFTNYGRCNIPGQQILYCATSEAGAYWETKPRNGDVITISHFELKPGKKVNCNVIQREMIRAKNVYHPLVEIRNLLEEFLIDAFSLEVSRGRPADYLFSALLSSELLFHPVVSDKNIEAIIYPSVQKKKYGENFAIRNDLILERYNLIGVETRFILEENEFLDPISDDVTTDQLISSFGTTAFDFVRGKILYDEKVDGIFHLFRQLQTGEGKQIRYEHTDVPKDISFDLTPKDYNKSKREITVTMNKIGRNDKVNVVYQDGKRVDNIKYKRVLGDVERGLCRVISH